MHAPLAERMRPKTLIDYVGQSHLIGEKGMLSGVIKSGNIPSLILWGPPGVGKTTLANLIANELGRKFYTLSAINSGVKDVREVIEKAEKSGLFGSTGNPILFIDEIHRFSKSQQDSLLGAVEKGTITLIGATTENPSFEVISALLSRTQVYTLNELSKSELHKILENALANDPLISKQKIILKESEYLILLSGGDARKLLNIFELVLNQVFGSTQKKITITNELVKELVKNQPALYDKDGEQHYDIISAFIKSIRGSDPQAAVYWLARMIEGGEKPEFIVRRLIILASEDIGLANPNALLMATSTLEAVKMVGWPESRIILSQCAIYLATSPKSNSAYMAINHAQAICKQEPNLPVPFHLRNAPTKLMKELGYGKNYKYAHDFPGNFIKQDYLPETLKNTQFYKPGDNPKEKSIEDWLNKKWQS
jgi:putative ATPase